MSKISDYIAKKLGHVLIEDYINNSHKILDRGLCPICEKEPMMDCVYGEYDYWGEFDCSHPDYADELHPEYGRDCDDCPSLACEKCRRNIVKI